MANATGSKPDPAPLATRGLNALEGTGLPCCQSASTATTTVSTSPISTPPPPSYGTPTQSLPPLPSATTTTLPSVPSPPLPHRSTNTTITNNNKASTITIIKPSTQTNLKSAIMPATPITTTITTTITSGNIPTDQCHRLHHHNNTTSTITTTTTTFNNNNTVFTPQNVKHKQWTQKWSPHVKNLSGGPPVTLVPSTLFGSSITWPGGGRGNNISRFYRICLAVLLALALFSHGVQAPCPPGCTCKVTNPKNRGQNSRESHSQPALLQPSVPSPGSIGPTAGSGGSSKVGVTVGTTSASTSAAPKNRTILHKVSCSENEQPFTDLSEMIKNDLPDNVVQLDLRKNAIKALKQGDFTNLSSLQKLDLSHNQIESIEPGTFENLTNLLRLDISYNKLTYIDASMFVGLSSVEKFYLSQNLLPGVTEGSFANMTSLRKIDFQSSQLRCDCHLQWIVRWSKNNSVKIQDTTVCAMPSDVKDRPIKDLKRKDLHCERPLELPVFELLPSTNQIVFEGDKLPFECRAFKIDAAAEMFWVRKGERMRTNRTAGIFLHQTFIHDRQIMINRLVIEKLDRGHQGVWECQVTTPRGNVSDSVNVVVIPSNALYCSRKRVRTTKGMYLWKKTVTGIQVQQLCNFGRNQYATYFCNEYGHWQDLDVSRCDYVIELTRKLSNLATKSVDEKNALDQARGLRDILSGSSGKIKHSIEVTLVAVCLSKLSPYAHKAGGQIFNIMLDTASDILNLNDKLLLRAQHNNNSCSRIMKSLEVMTQYVLRSHSHKSGRTQNIYMEAFNETVANYRGMSCLLRGSLTPSSLPYSDVRFRCRPGDGLTSYLESTRKDIISAIYLPETLFHNSDLQLSKTSTIGLQFAAILDPSGFPIIKLRDPKLEGKKWKVASKIISGSVGYSITNLSDPAILVFHTPPSLDRDKLQAVYWDFYSNNGLGEWRTDGCSIVGHQRNHTIVHCYHLTNFALLQNLTPPLRTGFVMMEPVIYFGSCVCVLCMMAVIITYTTCFRFLRVPKKMKHSVINISLSILLLVIGFTMGINRVDNRRACQIVGISIHYCSLCCIFWVTITSNNMLKKFAKAERPPPPPPEPLITPLPPKPMLRFYLLGWGVPLIICGITAAVNMDHYAGMEYCYLSWDPGLGAFYGPVALLVGINLVYFLRISCVIRGSTANPSYSEETEELHVNEIELSPNQDLHHHHLHHHHHHHHPQHTHHPTAANNNNNNNNNNATNTTTTTTTATVSNQPLPHNHHHHHHAPPSIPLHVNNNHHSHSNHHHHHSNHRGGGGGGGSSVSGSRHHGGGGGGCGGGGSVQHSDSDCDSSDEVSSVTFSILDEERRPITQLRALVTFLFLFIVAWVCAAFAVAPQPFRSLVPKQELVFSYLYGLSSVVLGGFLVGFFCLLRDDSRECWRRFFCGGGCCCCCCGGSGGGGGVGGERGGYYYDRDDDGAAASGEQQEIGRIPPSSQQQQPNVVNNPMMATHINGHVRSGSSVDGESLTGKMYNNERSNCSGQKLKASAATTTTTTNIDRPVKQINLVPLQGQQAATFTDGGSVVSGSAHDAPYPNFYNPRQNGVAKKFWEKNRHNHLKLINKEINKDLSDFNSVNFDDPTKRYSHCTSSDANWSIDLQLGPPTHEAPQKQPSVVPPVKIPNQQLPLNIHGPSPNTPPPLFPALPLERNQIPPVGGPTSPETMTGSPCSFVSPSGSQTLPPCYSPGTSSLTSYQPSSSAFTPVQPKRCNTLPKTGKVAPDDDDDEEELEDAEKDSNDPYMVRDGSVPRLRDFDGQSELSVDPGGVVGHGMVMGGVGLGPDEEGPDKNHLYHHPHHQQQQHHHHHHQVLQGYLPPTHNNSNNNPSAAFQTSTTATNNKDPNAARGSNPHHHHHHHNQLVAPLANECPAEKNNQNTPFGPSPPPPHAHSHPHHMDSKCNRCNVQGGGGGGGVEDGHLSSSSCSGGGGGGDGNQQQRHYHHHHHHHHHHHNNQQQQSLAASAPAAAVDPTQLASHTNPHHRPSPSPNTTTTAAVVANNGHHHHHHPPTNHLGCKCESDDNNSSIGSSSNNNKQQQQQQVNDNQFVFHESDSQVTTGVGGGGGGSKSHNNSHHHHHHHDSDHHSDPTHQRRHHRSNSHHHHHHNSHRNPPRLSKQHSLGWDEQFKDRPPKVPYAYVNHSYQEKVIQKLLQKCEEDNAAVSGHGDDHGQHNGSGSAGSGSTSSGLHWFPRSYSSYEQQQSHHHHHHQHRHHRRTKGRQKRSEGVSSITTTTTKDDNNHLPTTTGAAADDDDDDDDDEVVEGEDGQLGRDEDSGSSSDSDSLVNIWLPQRQNSLSNKFKKETSV
ncbi:adhesion G protein-coupled receptor A3-like [Argonauta hians]